MTRRAIRRDGAASLQDGASDRKLRRVRRALYGSTLRGTVAWSTSPRLSLFQYGPEAATDLAQFGRMTTGTFSTLYPAGT
jgi:hypothetical protein